MTLMGRHSCVCAFVHYSQSQFQFCRWCSAQCAGYPLWISRDFGEKISATICDF